MARTGVLLLGFGGPDSIESVQPFMCNLMGRVPSPELVERICGNYNTIGGRSPLVIVAVAGVLFTVPSFTINCTI